MQYLDRGFSQKEKPFCKGKRQNLPGRQKLEGNFPLPSRNLNLYEKRKDFPDERRKKTPDSRQG